MPYTDQITEIAHYGALISEIPSDVRTMRSDGFNQGSDLIIKRKIERKKGQIEKWRWKMKEIISGCTYL